MLSEEVATLLAQCFQGGIGPSHDELTRAFERAGLSSAEPDAKTPVGKVKRIREVLGYALDREPKSGEKLVGLLVDGIRAHGGFRPSATAFIGEDLVSNLRQAFRQLGFDLDAEGYLRPSLLENLDGAQLTEALWTYVRRARTGAADPELVIGTAKNLEEATARHVLKEISGSYPTTGPQSSFPMILSKAFVHLGLNPSSAQLSREPYQALQEAIFLLGLSVNRLRNARGDGHGRPEKPVANALESRLSAQAGALVSELLLTTLQG